MKILFQPTMDNFVVVPALFISFFLVLFLRHSPSWTCLLWHQQCQLLEGPHREVPLIFLAEFSSCEAAFAVICKSYQIWGHLKIFPFFVLSGHFLDTFKDLEICLEPEYTWLTPEKFSFWASGAAKLAFFFLHPDQCGLIQGFQLGSVRLWPSCSIWLFHFLWCSVL